MLAPAGHKKQVYVVKKSHLQFGRILYVAIFRDSPLRLFKCKRQILQDIFQMHETDLCG